MQGKADKPLPDYAMHNFSEKWACARFFYFWAMVSRWFYMSFQDHIFKKVIDLVKPVVEDKGLELVDVEYRREAGGFVLRIIVFKEDGVTVDDCAGLSREVSQLLDVEDILDHGYNLEVSSPGLTRPLKNRRDFERNIGAEVKLTSKLENGGTEVIGGVIRDIGDDSVTLEGDSGLTSRPLTRIVKGKLVIEF
ncbi:MAG: ribosome maturation factor RimP [Thermodesulfobacteriota bacterium]